MVYNSHNDRHLWGSQKYFYRLVGGGGGVEGGGSSPVGIVLTSVVSFSDWISPISTSIPQLVYQQLWYVLSYLLESAYKSYLAAYENIQWPFIKLFIINMYMSKKAPTI